MKATSEPDDRDCQPTLSSPAQSPLRVLHCPTMTRGNPYGLAAAERELGLLSWSLALEQTQYDFRSDEVIFPGPAPPIPRELHRWRLLWRALRKYDLIHFNCGQSLMPVWIGIGSPRPDRYPRWARNLYGYYVRALEQCDLPLLKRAGKGIVVTYQGEDARQGDFCRSHLANQFVDEVEPGYYSAESDARKRLRIKRFARYADRMYSLCPDLLHVLPSRAEFLPYAHVDPRQWLPVDRGPATSRPPIVLHAPSHRGVKGTRFLLDAVARLQQEGVELEFMLVENMSHAAARQMYERADLLVDQMLVGWYGGLAVELMALGKPVMCYLRDADLHFVPPTMRTELPMIRITPDSVYEVLKEWLTRRRPQLCEVGRRSRAFVERWHDPLLIAQRLKDDYQQIMQEQRER